MSNATAKQIAFINALLGQKAVDADTRETVAFELTNELSIKGASFWIDQLKRLPYAKSTAPVVPVLDIEVTPRARVSEEGFYKADDGSAFKVVRSMRGNLYAKEATARGLMYREGAMTLLFADQKMTGEEIAAHGVANCFCVNCSTPLEDPTSKRIGLGTSCGPQLLGKEGYKRAKAAVAHFADVVAFETAKKADAKARREAKKAAEAQLVLV